MSGLAALLAGRVGPDVYRWHAMFEADDVRHTVELADWRFAHYSGWIHEDKAEVLAGLGEALSFPDHYGRNLDALADALKDVVAEDGKGTVLLWDGWTPLARAQRRSFDALVEVLQGRAKAERGGPFAVLLRGDGERAGPFAAELPADVPEIADLPSLD